MAERINNGKQRDRVGVLLYVIYILMLILSLLIFGKIIYIQIAFKPDEELYRKLTPRNINQRVEASRGNILSCDGRMLAMTFPVYDVTLDCTVAKDTLWNNNVAALANGLSKTLGGHNAQWYKASLSKGRRDGNTHLQLCKGVDIKTLKTLKSLPILEKGRYKGGIIEFKRNTRHYPYGNMARRTIGFVRISDGKIKNTHVGLEGRFDKELRGTDGSMWLKMTDYGVVQNYDSTFVKPEDGMDIRTTLDIDFQTIVDRALKAGISEENELEGGCCVVMDVKTGAIKAMSNLLRNPKNHGKMEEISNLAIGRKGEPGSVFKTTNLMIMLENGHIKSLQETIPTNGGLLEGYRYEADKHIKDYEKEHHTHKIPIIEGFKVSSNYMFRYLAIKYYEDKPQKYIDQLYKFHLGEAFDFDVEGLAKPVLPDPSNKKYWSKTDLTGTAIGYSVDETPLHILTFYNAIANKGKMMKPYLVEDMERYGIVEKKSGTAVLGEKICSRATADTLTRALMAVVEDGTAQRLKGAPCTVAGKTGTSRVALPEGGYFTADGKKKNQGTFVGFFPAEDPQYSIICVVYSYLTEKSFYGGTIPAAVVRQVIDQIYTIDPYWQGTLKKSIDIEHI